MKKIIPFLLGGLFVLGATACSEQPNANDTNNGVRSDQIESDARAREQRDGAENVATGDEQQMSDNLAADARNTLEANLPGSQLTVDVIKGVATVEGNVVNQAQLDSIESIVNDIEGIKSVTVNAVVGQNP